MVAAFVYMAMAGAKSLRIYSFEEAGRWFDAAFSLLEAHADCAADAQVAAALADYVLYLNASFQPKIVIATMERCRDRIDRGGDSQPAIVIHHHYTLALLFLGRYSESHAAQECLSAMAARIGDAPAAAYALTSGMWLSSTFVPGAAEISEATAARAAPVLATDHAWADSDPKRTSVRYATTEAAQSSQRPVTPLRGFDILQDNANIEVQVGAIYYDSISRNAACVRCAVRFAAATSPC
jgi:hypothetical protein